MAGQGALQLRAVSRRLREMGSEGNGLNRELQAGLQRGARPAINAIRWEALLTLPSSGGSQIRKLKIVNRAEIDGRKFVYRRRAGALKDNESLAHRVANASYVVRNVGGQRNPQIQIRGKAGKQTLDLRSINDGLVRHPVFGNREHWVDQHVQAGFFVRACQANQDEVLKGIREAIATVVAKLNE